MITLTTNMGTTVQYIHVADAMFNGLLVCVILSLIFFVAGVIVGTSKNAS